MRTYKTLATIFLLALFFHCFILKALEPEPIRMHYHYLSHLLDKMQIISYSDYYKIFL